MRLRPTLVSVLLLWCVGPLASAQKPDQDTREQAWQVLHSGLHNSRASHRRMAVQALSLMQGNGTAVLLAIRALDDKDYHVRAAAAVSLGQLHARRAIPQLHAALEDREVAVVLGAAYSLYLLHDPKAYDVYYAILMGDRKASDGLIQSQLDRLKDPKQMLKLGFEEGIGFVPFGGMSYEAFQQLRSKGDSGARAAAARILAKDPDQITEDALVQTAVADSNEDVRLAALDALAERGDPKCVETLARNLTDGKPEVAYRTAATIIHLGDVQRRNRRSGR